MNQPGQALNTNPYSLVLIFAAKQNPLLVFNPTNSATLFLTRRLYCLGHFPSSLLGYSRRVSSRAVLPMPILLYIPVNSGGTGKL